MRRRKAPARTIASSPPNDGREWDCQCARCGSSVSFDDCDHCGGEGVDGHDCGEDTCCCLDPEDNMVCDMCDGSGGWRRCLSSEEFCEANPLPGRKGVLRGEIEWFVPESPSRGAR